MTKRSPAYTPLVNKHFRFYFSNPDRTCFESSVDEKQFNAVRRVVTKLTDNQQTMLKIVMYPSVKPVTGDGYINANITSLAEHVGISKNEIYSLVTQTSKEIAIELEYISDERRNANERSNRTQFQGRHL